MLAGRFGGRRLILRLLTVTADNAAFRRYFKKIDQELLKGSHRICRSKRPALPEERSGTK